MQMFASKRKRSNSRNRLNNNNNNNNRLQQVLVQLRRKSNAVLRFHATAVVHLNFTVQTVQNVTGIAMTAQNIFPSTAYPLPLLEEQFHRSRLRCLECRVKRYLILERKPV